MQASMHIGAKPCVSLKAGKPAAGAGLLSRPLCSRSSTKVASAAEGTAEVLRRSLLLTGLSSPLLLLAPSPSQAEPQKVVYRQPKDLGTLDRAAQKEAFLKRVKAALTEVSSLTHTAYAPSASAHSTLPPHPHPALLQSLSVDDAPGCLRLVLHCAGTYDVGTKTGGMDGSIVTPCVPTCPATHAHAMMIPCHLPPTLP